MATSYGKPKSQVAQPDPAPVDDDGWESVNEGAPQKWVPQEVGDNIVGIYMGFEDITIQDVKTGEDKDIRYYDIRDDDGNLWSVPNSFQIAKGFERKLSDDSPAVNIGDTVRLTFTGEVDLGKPGRNNMKNYKLDVRRNG